MDLIHLGRFTEHVEVLAAEAGLPKPGCFATAATEVLLAQFAGNPQFIVREGDQDNRCAPLLLTQEAIQHVQALTESDDRWKAPSWYPTGLPTDFFSFAQQAVALLHPEESVRD